MHHQLYQCDAAGDELPDPVVGAAQASSDILASHTILKYSDSTVR